MFSLSVYIFDKNNNFILRQEEHIVLFSRNIIAIELRITWHMMFQLEIALCMLASSTIS